MQRKKLFFVLPIMKGGGVEAVASVLMNHIDRERYAITLVLFNEDFSYQSICHDRSAELGNPLGVGIGERLG